MDIQNFGMIILVLHKLENMLLIKNIIIRKNEIN